MRRLSGSLSLGARECAYAGAPHGAAVDRSPARPAGGLRSGLRRLHASSRARRGGRRERRTATQRVSDRREATLLCILYKVYSLFPQKGKATLLVLTLVARRRRVHFECLRV